MEALNNEVVALYKVLINGSGQKRAQAKAKLRQMGPDGAVAMASVLQQEARRHRRFRRVYNSVLTLCAVLGLIMLLAGNSAIGGTLLIIAFGLLGGGAGIVVDSYLQRRVVEALAQHCDVRAVGPLAQALEFE